MNFYIFGGFFFEEIFFMLKNSYLIYILLKDSDFNLERSILYI